MNVIWVWRPSDITALSDNDLSVLMSKYKNAAFDVISIPLWGSYDANGNLYLNNESTTQFKRAAFLAQDFGIDAYGYKYTGGTEIPNIANTTIKTNVLNEIENKILPLPGLRGYIDDFETDFQQGFNEAAYVSYMNSVASLCRSASKKGGAYLLASTYPYQKTRLGLILPYLDVDLLVFPTKNPEYINLIAQIGKSPWIPHLQVESGFNNEIETWNKLASARPNKMQGFGVWAYPFFKQADLDLWQQWTLKGTTTAPTPEPTPEPEPTPTPTKTVAARVIGPFSVPVSMLHLLWKLRQKFIRPEVHRKLHPLV